MSNSLHQYECSFSDFLIAIIYSEAGPLCVSPTGQFIVPSTCPGTILVDFLASHMNEAAEKSEEYRMYVSTLCDPR